MKRRPLYGRIGFWLRELSDTIEGTIPGVCSTITNYGGGSCLCLKVADGLNWVGSYDSKTPINSLADLQTVHDQCKAAGCTFLPVVVPRGTAGEAAFHASIAQTIGALMFDLEPYAGARNMPIPITFWDGSPTSNIPAYCAAVRAAAPDAYLMAQPDPRSYGWSATYMDQVIQYMDGLCAQHYVGWEGAGWTDIPTEVASFARDYGTGLDVYVTLYGADPTFPNAETIPLQFWQQISAHALGVCWFAFGPMNAAQLRAAAGAGPSVVPDPIDPLLASSTSIVAPSSVTAGDSFTVNVTVVGSGSPGPTGSVTLSDETGHLWLSVLLQGGMTFTLQYPSAGAHVLTVAYSGDDAYAGSQASTTISVNAVPTPPSPPAISAERLQLGWMSASDASDLLDPDLADADVLPRVLASVEAIATTINGGTSS